MNGKSLGWLLVVILCTITNVNSYRKYGRTCKDIGCVPGEQCVIKTDSCSYTQREGSDCGSFPTCERTSATRQSSPGANLNPAPENTFFSRPSNPSRDTNTMSQPNAPTPINPNYVFGARQNPPVYPDNVPIFPHHAPTSPPPFQQFPQPNHPRLNQNVPQPYPNNPFSANNFVFGNQPPNFYYSQTSTTKEPSLFHQFLYNKQDRNRKRGNTSSKLLPGPILLVISLVAFSITSLT